MLVIIAIFGFTKLTRLSISPFELMPNSKIPNLSSEFKFAKE